MIHSSIETDRTEFDTIKSNQFNLRSARNKLKFPYKTTLLFLLTSVLILLSFYDQSIYWLKKRCKHKQYNVNPIIDDLMIHNTYFFLQCHYFYFLQETQKKAFYCLIIIAKNIIKNTCIWRKINKSCFLDKCLCCWFFFFYSHGHGIVIRCFQTV